MTIEEQIEVYLQDDDSLYEDWYIKQSQHESGIEFGEPVSSLEDKKKAISNWAEIHKSALKEKVCPNIDKIKAIGKPINAVLFIASLFEDLGFVGAATQIASYLVNKGVEKLCESYEG